VDAAPQFIALAQLDGSVLQVNPGGRRMAGIPSDVDVTTTTIADYLTEAASSASIEVEQPAVVRDGTTRGEHPAALADRRRDPGPGRLVPRQPTR
jgi:PAS domain-containing protein